MYKFPRMNVKPLPHQIDGFNWFKKLSENNLGGILSDTMGVGKTYQALSYIKSEVTEFPESKVLIIVPAGLVFNWKSEFAKFTDLHPAVSMYGDREEKINSSNIVITSYQTFVRDSSLYSTLGLTHIILDEGQYVKNKWNKTYGEIRKLNRTTKNFILTGTPLENSLDNLINLLKLVNRNDAVINAGNINELRDTLILRRTGEVVNLDNVTRKLVRTKLHESQVKVNNDLQNCYNQRQHMFRSAQQQVADMRSNHEIVPEELSERVMKLNQLVRSADMKLKEWLDSPLLLKDNENLKGAFNKQIMKDVDVTRMTSTKFNDFTKLVNKLKNSGHRTIVFSQFTKMLDVITNDLPKGLTYRRIDGNTSSEKRYEYCEEFNNDTSIDLMIISLRAGGTGLNITGADSVILYDLWWNPQVEEQAIGRANRIGQTKRVTVYKMVTKNTFEEKILKSQKRKVDLFDYYINKNKPAENI